MRPMTEADFMVELGSGSLDATLDALENFVRSHGYHDVARVVRDMHAAMEATRSDYMDWDDLDVVPSEQAPAEQEPK
jgi:hypothetical protein